MEWLRIGDVARRTGLTHRTLRHYDDLGLLVPSGRSGGDYRLYSEEDLERLLAIQHLKSLGLGLPEIAAALDDPDFDASATLARHIGAVEERIAVEQDLLTRLRRLQDAAGQGWEEVLEVIALSERLRHPEASVRFRAALDASGQTPVADLLDLLRSDPADGVREVATWALVQHGASALDAVVAELHDPDAGVRRQMAHVLGKLADPRAVPALAGLLDDPDPEVAAKAAFGLGQIGGPDAVAALVGVLGRGPATLRATIVAALGRLGTRATAALVTALESDDAARRADAAETLGLIEDPRSAVPLGRLVDDPSPDVRLAALMALSSLGTDESATAITAAADHPDERTRLLARRLSPSGD